MSATRGRLALCYGTRPQVVKASALAAGLRDDWEIYSIDTGQHYDWELHGLHYEQLRVSPPDLFLEVRSGSHAAQTAAVIERASEALTEYEPDVVVVIGDTNSTLGCALAAAKNRMFVTHVEAGLRSDDLYMAEEINRRVVDEISTLLCAPSRTSADYLSARVSEAQSVAFTGDVARDVLEASARLPAVAEAPWTAHDITPPYVLSTLHRAELTSRADWLTGAIEGLGKLPYPVFFPAHPRTVAVLEECGLATRLPDNVVLSPPVGYLDMIAWLRGAEAVVTDSGGLQREAYWTGTPCVTIRTESEWTETVDEGANVLVDPAHAIAVADALASHAGRTNGWVGDAYGTGQAVVAIRDALRRHFD